jgi:hypothetical protein
VLDKWYKLMFRTRWVKFNGSSTTILVTSLPAKKRQPTAFSTSTRIRPHDVFPTHPLRTVPSHQRAIKWEQYHLSISPTANSRDLIDLGIELELCAVYVYIQRDDSSKWKVDGAYWGRHGTGKEVKGVLGHTQHRYRHGTALPPPSSGRHTMILTVSDIITAFWLFRLVYDLYSLLMYFVKFAFSRYL